MREWIEPDSMIASELSMINNLKDPVKPSTPSENPQVMKSEHLLADD